MVTWNISTEYWWNDNNRENQSAQRKICPWATIVHHKSHLELTWDQSILTLNITNNELKYTIRKLSANITAALNVIKYWSDLCIVKPISTDHLYIVSQVWLIYCGPNKSDTLKTSLQQLFPAFIILHLRSLQKKWTDISLLFTYIDTYIHTHIHASEVQWFCHTTVGHETSQYQTTHSTNTIWWLQNNKLKTYNF